MNVIFTKINYSVFLSLITFDYSHKMVNLFAILLLFYSIMLAALSFSGFNFDSQFRKTSTLHLQSIDASFLSLRKLDDRCKRLSERESDFLLGFFNKKLHCFQVYPHLNTNRVSVTSTCIAVDAILANPGHWEGLCAWETNADDQISLKAIVAALISTNWTPEGFQIPLLITTICATKGMDKDDPKYVAALETLIEQRPRLTYHRHQNRSSYVRYHNTKALLDVVNSNMIPASFSGSGKITFSLERANMIAFDDLCRQLAFFNCGDRSNFDVIVLAYSLLSYYETSESSFLSSFARGVIEPTNIKLVQKALEVIFSVQSDDGTWRKGEPIFTQSTSGNNRDIGNWYVFFFDLIASLLGVLTDKEPQLMAQYLPQLERCLTWAESNVLQEMLPEVCDPTTFRCRGSVIEGWRSNHLGSGGAAGWCTAHVFRAITKFRKLLRTLISNSILEEFGGRQGGSPSAREWDSLMDADLELAGFKSTLKSEINDRFISPLINKELSTSAALFPPSPASPSKITYRKPNYSLILFGPPGTAKTTICTSLAARLGWSFLTIDTADFLADGLQNVASRMTHIFERLCALERTIILFDEIEEFCLDRENPSLAMESRLLTTAMLTQLNDLRRKQSSAFIVATNRLRSFDAAVTRPGRFDMLLFVGTPNLLSREARIATKLQTSRLAPSVQESSLAVAREFLDNRWDVIRFMTFAESEAFASSVVDLAVRGELSRENLVMTLNSILRTATIQGSVRDDYLASELLSRV